MADNGGQTGRKGDAALLLALAAGQTIRDAALAAGIGERTATRRVADVDFRRRVCELRGEMVGRALGKLADVSARAVDTLARLLDSQSDSVRLGAARVVLETGNRLRETIEYEERIAALENLARKEQSK